MTRGLQRLGLVLSLVLAAACTAGPVPAGATGNVGNVGNASKSGGQNREAAACAPDRVDLRGDWGQASFSIELADDPGERAEGLMFRREMAADHGMLFVYERPQPARFWMRNTYLPLDLIFFDPEGRATRVHEDARPLDETVIDGGDGVLFVLEVLAGTAERLGIARGTQLRHPALDAATAAWPCDG